MGFVMVEEVWCDACLKPAEGPMHRLWISQDAQEKTLRRVDLHQDCLREVTLLRVLDNLPKSDEKARKQRQG